MSALHENSKPTGVCECDTNTDDAIANLIFVSGGMMVLDVAKRRSGNVSGFGGRCLHIGLKICQAYRRSNLKPDGSQFFCFLLCYILEGGGSSVGYERCLDREPSLRTIYSRGLIKHDWPRCDYMQSPSFTTAMSPRDEHDLRQTCTALDSSKALDEQQGYTSGS